MHLAPLALTGLLLTVAGAPVPLPGAEDSWADRVLGLVPLPDAAPAWETRSVPELVAALYAHLGVDAAPYAAALRLQTQALPVNVRVGLQQVLGALDQAFMDRNAIGVLRALDAALPLLASAPSPTTRAPLFPGPNDGVLFNDPFNLILVGDVGPSVYRGNTWPFDPIAPPEHLLIVDLGGEDSYLNHPAAARGGPVCSHRFVVGRGVAVSVVLDLSGNDVYTPAASSGSIAHAQYRGVAVLLDVLGNDQYVASPYGLSEASAFSQGTAMLLDGAGLDTYQSFGGSQAQAHGLGSTAVLLDLQGQDTYVSGESSQANAYGGTAVLADLQGDDAFTVFGFGQGRVQADGFALFLNVGGNDAYTSLKESRGSADNGVATFLDVCGVDFYKGWLGQNDAFWQQDAYGFGEDTRDAGLCAGNE